MRTYEYRNYTLYRDSPGDWRFFHNDLNDVEDERCGYAESMVDAKSQIDQTYELPFDIGIDAIYG